MLPRYRAPSQNWHQSLVYYVASTDPQDTGMKKHVPLLLLGSFLMILFQCMTSVGVLVGTFSAACDTSDQCGQGKFCEVAVTSRCRFCGETVPMPMQTLSNGDTLNWAQHERYSGYNTSLAVELCAAAADPEQPDFRVKGVDAVSATFTFYQASISQWCEYCVHPIDMTVDPVTYVGMLYTQTECHIM
jgi:hypothetical protein